MLTPHETPNGHAHSLWDNNELQGIHKMNNWFLVFSNLVNQKQGVIKNRWSHSSITLLMTNPNQSKLSSCTEIPDKKIKKTPAAMVND